MAIYVDEETGYSVDGTSNLIVSLGQFQGAPRYLPYFWQCYLEGDGTAVFEDDTEITEFAVTPGEVAMFPELAGKDTVRLYQDDQGFVGEC